MKRGAAVQGWSAARVNRRAIAWLLLVAAGCVVLLVAVDQVFVHTYRGQLVDDAALRGTTIGRRHIIDPVSHILDLVSVGALAAATLAVGVVAFLRRRPVLALLAMLLVVGSNVTTEVVKHKIFTRPVLAGTDRLPFNTLPSGHTTVALSVAVAITLVAPRRLRGLVSLVAVAYGAATGVAVLAAGWHRPSDAVTSCVVVGFWTAVVGALACALGPADRRPRGPNDSAYNLLVAAYSALALALVAIGTAALVVTAYTVPQPASKPRLFLAYAGGAAAVAGAAFAVMAMLLLIARRARTDELDGPATQPERPRTVAESLP